MRYDARSTLRSQGSLFVKITASDGTVGYATGFGGPPACWLIEEHFKRFVVGQDPRNTNVMWEQVGVVLAPHGGSQYITSYGIFETDQEVVWSFADVQGVHVLRPSRASHPGHLRRGSRHMGPVGQDQERTRLQDDRGEDQAGDPALPYRAVTGRGQEDGFLGRKGGSLGVDGIGGETWWISGD